VDLAPTSICLHDRTWRSLPSPAGDQHPHLAASLKRPPCNYLLGISGRKPINMFAKVCSGTSSRRSRARKLCISFFPCSLSFVRPQAWWQLGFLNWNFHYTPFVNRRDYCFLYMLLTPVLTTLNTPGGSSFHGNSAGPSASKLETANDFIFEIWHYYSWQRALSKSALSVNRLQEYLAY